MKGYKRLPYGNSDFEAIISDNRYLVDKTRFIPMLEDRADYLFLIRPRRFGKSLFLSMLESYYDINRKDRFDELFGSLWIGKHPTGYRNRFLILKLDFSLVTGPIDRLEERFQAYLSEAANDFVRRYRRFLSDYFIKDYQSLPPLNGDYRLMALEKEAKARRLDMYLIVDEYDNFTNDVLSQHGESVYHDLTHAEGFYRGVFKKFKAMFRRIFMMGVSPVTLDDLTSGFNIGWHISNEAAFNTMLGFSEQDVREMLQYYKDSGMPVGDVDEVIADMKPWYDNYCFAEDALDKDPTVFNCDMVLYYVNNLFAAGRHPKDMLSSNIKVDYAKIKRLIQLDKLDGDREGVLMKIAQDGYIYDKVATTYPAMDLVKPSMFVSQLYYYGLLTITGIHFDSQILSIPNHNIREQFYTWMLEHYSLDGKSIDIKVFSKCMEDMAGFGQWRPALEYIAGSYEENSVVRSMIQGERNVQGYIQAYLSLCKLYLAAPEMELAGGFSGLILMPDSSHLSYKDVKHSYIIELKYVKTEDSEETAAKVWQDA